jgi:hypothetical protein
MGTPDNLRITLPPNGVQTPIGGLRVKRLALLTFAVIATLVAAILSIRFVPDKIIWHSEINQGNEVVRKVELFRRTHGKLPSTIADLTVSNSLADRFYYQRCDENRYIVWFGTTLGESLTYDSGSRDWASINILCN